MSKISYDEAVKLGLTKECSKCHKVKAVKEFNRSKKGKYGANSECKECRAQYNKIYRQEHREEIAKYRQEHGEEIAKYNKQHYQKHKKEIAKYNKQHYQKHKKEIINHQREYYQNNKKEIINRQREYYQNNKEEVANYKRQYNQTHKEEKAKYNKQYSQAHKEEIAIQRRQYYQTPQGKEATRKAKRKRRALKNQSFYQPFTQEDKEFCLNYFNHRCPYTGKPFTDSEFHIDHIVPLSDKDGIGATAPWNMLLCDASTNISKSNKPVLEFINSLPNPEQVYNKIRDYIILQAKRYIDIIPKDDVTLKTFNITFEELED